MSSDAIDYWFFLSYARDDRDDYLKEFYNDLNTEVRRLSGGKIESSGFFDGESIDVGEEWPEELTAALSVSRAFVCVQSPTYFGREYCGKEWAIFRLRQSEYLRDKPPGTKLPPLIFPVLWVAARWMPKNLPDIITDIQFTHDDFGPEYKEKGLRGLKVLNRYKDNYNEFVMNFAAMIMERVDQYTLPRLQSVPDIKTIMSAFVSQQPQAVSDKEMEDLGPRCAEFILLAASNQEIQTIRSNVESYGEYGGQWKPFLPDSQLEVGSLTQTVTNGEKLLYQSLPFYEGLLTRIRNAEAKNRIVVLVIDLWSLQLQKYKDFWRDFMTLNPQNCAVLVPSNDNDEETRQNLPLLEDEEWKRFRDKGLQADPNSFIVNIRSVKEMKQAIITALHMTRKKVIENDQNIKRIEDGQVSQLPIISGPGLRAL